MRRPADDADQQRTRRRDHAAGRRAPVSPSGAPGQQSQQPAADRGGSDPPGTAAGQQPRTGSVFVPGYDAGRQSSGAHAVSQGAPASGPAWYGGAAGKGPVRGYPPAPGQPAPMYPPGQFAAWNRQQGRGGAAAGQRPDRNGPGRDPLGAGDAGRSGTDRHDAAGAASWPAGDAGAPENSWQSPAARPPVPDGTHYYGHDAGPGAEPGYSVLAVSDPAADVTSTQTWQAVDDGRATGTWTAPVLPGAGASQPRNGPGEAGDGRTRPARDQQGTAPPLPRRAAHAQPGRVPVSPASAGPGGSAAGVAESGLFGPAASGPLPAASVRAGQAPSGRATSLPAPSVPAAGSAVPGPAGSAPAASAPAGPAPSVAARSRDGEAAGSKRPARGHGAHTGPHTIQRPRRKRPASVKAAFSCALLLVVAAAGALAYAVLHNPVKPRTAGLPKPARSAPSPQPSPTLGIYGHIGSRSSDPVPLTVAQLYPASFRIGSDPVTRAISQESARCGQGAVGSGIQSALKTAKCDQVARATYLSGGLKIMGTIGVFNLGSGAAAEKAAKSAGAVNFVAELRTHKGLTSKIGKGTGIEEAAAKGHYLILIWAEFTDLRKPRTSAQRDQLERFMTQLLDKTANVSLASRMANGTP